MKEMYKTQTFCLRQKQLQKKRLLEREFLWIKEEFKDFKTLGDIDVYNVEPYGRLFLEGI